MIVFKIWKARRYSKLDRFRVEDTWLRKGWFLFGFIPLCIRDIENRERL